MLDKFLKKINLNLDYNQKWIMCSTLICGFVLTYVTPTISKEIFSNLPTEFIASQNLFSSISALGVGICWKGKLRKKAIKNFLRLITIESVGAFLVSLYLTFVKYDIWIFAIATVLYTSLITVFISKCILFFQTKLWSGEKRETFDNNYAIIVNLTCILGYTTSVFAHPSIEVAIILWGIICLLDHIAWGFVYKREHLGEM